MEEKRSQKVGLSLMFSIEFINFKYFEEKTSMNKGIKIMQSRYGYLKGQIKYISCLFLAYFAIGCGGTPSIPSEFYPEQLLFQHIDMRMSKNSVSLSISYQADGSVSPQKSNEYHTLNIEQAQYDLNDRGYLYLTLETLQQEIQGDESINIIFNRLNGNSLLSNALLPGFISLSSPDESEVIDISTQDLVIMWDPSLKNVDRLDIEGDCFNNYGFSRSWGNFDVGQSSLTIAAGSVLSLNAFTECNAKISVFQSISGIVDENFAGGDFNIELISQINFFITGLNNNHE